MQPRVLQHEVTGAGDPLVLVPGILTGWLSWIPHAERLAAGYRVVRVQPVHNELATRGEIPDGYDGAVERESFRMTLDALGVERADIAAWSGGARAMIEFSLAYPERVRTLTLVEPPALWVLEQAGRVLDDAQSVTAARFSAKVAGRPVSEEELLEFISFGGFVPAGLDPREQRNWPVWLANRHALASDAALAPSSRTLAELGAFDRPVLLVVGTDTSRFLKEIVEALGQTYPNARTLTLPGGHACHIENLDRFLKELGAFVEAG